MRIAILWTQLSGYMNSALKSLKKEGAELFVIHEKSGPASPFTEQMFSWIDDRISYSAPHELVTLTNQITHFKPDLVMATWHVPKFRSTCRALKGRAIRIGCADNQWLGTFRQRVGRLASRYYLRAPYDVLFVAGERQSEWARKMGFPVGNVWRGLYSCDTQPFLEASRLRIPNVRAFLYAGRLAPEKGIRDLVQAYSLYRNLCAEPWPLIIVGDGPCRNDVAGRPGIDWRGFVQPQDLPKAFAEASCFIIASSFEPWCVAIHEATCSALPLIVTDQCGAAVHLVQDNYNGDVVSAGRPRDLCEAMLRMSGRSSERLNIMGKRSSEMSKQFSTRRFADTVLEKGAALHAKL